MPNFTPTAFLKENAPGMLGGLGGNRQALSAICAIGLPQIRKVQAPAPLEHLELLHGSTLFDFETYRYGSFILISRIGLMSSNFSVKQYWQDER